jgi:hypothetical protein
VGTCWYPVFGSKLFTDCSLATLKPSAATVPDVEHLHHVAFDGEQDAIDVRSSAVEQLTDFDG